MKLRGTTLLVYLRVCAVLLVCSFYMSIKLAQHINAWPF